MKRIIYPVLMVALLCGCKGSDVDPSLTPRADTTKPKPTGDEDKLIVSIDRTFMRGIQQATPGSGPLEKPGRMEIHYSVQNTSDRPIKSFDVEITGIATVSKQTEKGTTHVDKFKQSCSVTENLLLPGHSTERGLLYLEMAEPKEEIGKKRVFTGKATHIDFLEPSEDYSDEHQVEWLIFEGKLDRLKAAFTRDPKLIEFKTSMTLKPIHLAVLQKNIEVVKYLESIGGKLTDVSDDNESALHFAALSTPEMVDYVSSRGIQSNTETADRKNPLFYACDGNNKTTVKALVKAGVSLKEANKQGVVPVAYAIAMSTAEVVAEFAAAGADMNAKIQNSLGLLSLAISNGRTETAKLIGKLRGIKEVDVVGNTPLHYAVRYNDVKLAKWLMEQGADPRVKNENGETPVDLANQSPYPTIQEAMLELMERK